MKTIDHSRIGSRGWMAAKENASLSVSIYGSSVGALWMLMSESTELKIFQVDPCMEADET